MKNAIKYYYNLDPISIRQKNKIFSFSVDKNLYFLINYNENNIDKIYEVFNYLSANKIKTNQIIFNNNNQILTNINNDTYVLIKVAVEIENIKIEDIIQFNNIYLYVKELDRSNWFDLWSKKIDYLEYQINQVGLRYKMIRESFSYYIGLAEMALCLIKNTDGKKNLVLCHKRIGYNETTFNLYNPLNYIVDYRFRDMCEYFKSAFFNNVNIMPLVKQYLLNLTNEEKYLFFARMAFPTYYFDCYEKIINKEIEEKEIIKIISKVGEYELFLSELYLYLNNILPEIDWIKKVIQH